MRTLRAWSLKLSAHGSHYLIITLTGVDIDGVCLPVVLGDLVVDGGHDVWPDGRLVDGGQGQRHPGGLGLLAVDGDDGTGGGQRLERNHRVNAGKAKGISVSALHDNQIR